MYPKYIPHEFLGQNQTCEQLQKRSVQVFALWGSKNVEKCSGQGQGDMDISDVPKHRVFTARLTRNSCVKYLKSSINYCSTDLLCFVTFS